MTSSPLIKLTGCSILFADKPALNAVDFSLHAGERWVLIGPNGSGKTLLLKLLAGILWATPTGQEQRDYCLNGDKHATSMDAKERIAYVGPEQQDKYVRYDWKHSVTQVVTTGLFAEDIPRTQPSAAQQRQVTLLLKQFRLWSLRERSFLTLSYGQRRRTLVARAFAQNPEVLLLDEVFNGLDAFSTNILQKALQSKRGIGSTWIVTTHREQDIPSAATRVARIEQGKVTSVGSIAKHKKPGALLTSIQKTIHSSSASVKKKRSAHEPLVRLSNVELYRDYRLVLRNVNWILERGEHWAVVGRNGSGKSTLLKLLYGDLHPRLGGSIERHGMEPGIPISEWKRRVGYVSPELQAEYFLARDLEEIVISGRYSSIGLNQPTTAADRKDARRWLKEFGLLSLATRRPREVSYGQLRLALIARAMMTKPELLLLDEPCDGLDTVHRQQVLDRLDALVEQGVQLIVAVHDLADLPRCVEHRLSIQSDKSVQSLV